MDILRTDLARTKDASPDFSSHKHHGRVQYRWGEVPKQYATQYGHFAQYRRARHGSRVSDAVAIGFGVVFIGAALTSTFGGTAQSDPQAKRKTDGHGGDYQDRRHVVGKGRRRRMKEEDL